MRGDYDKRLSQGHHKGMLSEAKEMQNQKEPAQHFLESSMTGVPSLCMHEQHAPSLTESP